MEHKLKATLITTLVLSGIYDSATAEVVMDGSAGTAGEVQATDNVYELTSDLGRINGSNLFHSFSEFSVEKNHTAHFSHNGPQNVSNVIARVTGENQSEIYGTIRSSIPGADFYLLNPNGILFGENASLNINGSFYASTANYIDFEDGSRMDTAAIPNATFTSAAPSAFGFTTKAPGGIDVNGSDLSVNEGKTISLIAGDITLDSASLMINDGIIKLVSVASEGEAAIAPDDVYMNFSAVGNIDLINGTTIDSSGNSGGRIVIRGGNLALDRSFIYSNTTGSDGNNYSENIIISAAESINLEDGSKINSNLEENAAGDSKGILLASKEININDYSGIEAIVAPDSTGDGGNVTINSEKLDLTNHSFINSVNLSTGGSGDVLLNVGTLSIIEGSYIGMAAYSEGDAGDIFLNTSNIYIKGPESSSDPFFADLTGIYSYKELEPSEGGNISINNSGSLVLDSRALIGTENSGSRKGGNLTINADSIDILSGSILGTVAYGAGNGGDIFITANELNLAGVHDEYDLDNLDFYRSSIFTLGPTELFSTGNTGELNITVDQLNVLDGAFIQSTSASSGKNGNTYINSKNVRISGINNFMVQTMREEEGFNYSDEEIIQFSSSYIGANTFFNDFGIGLPTPTAGTLNITADHLSLDSGGYITTETTGSADSQDVYLTVDHIRLNGGSYITSSAIFGTGNSGNLSVKATTIDIDGYGSTFTKTGFFSTTDETGGTGGNIHIETSELKLRNGAMISSQTTGDNDAGNIIVNVDQLIINDSTISSKAAMESTGNAGSIDIDSRLFVLNSSAVTTTAISGQGGDINIKANNLIISQDSMIDAASEQSISGTVNLNYKTDESSNLAQLTANVPNTQIFSGKRCGADSNSTSNFYSLTNFSPVNYTNFTISNYFLSKEAPEDIIDTSNSYLRTMPSYHFAVGSLDIEHKKVKSYTPCFDL